MQDPPRGEIKRAVLTWGGGLVFSDGEAGGAESRIDGDNATAPGPMLTLLLAAAACSGADVVSILGKMRVELREFRVEVSGERRVEEPRRYVALHLRYRLAGAGLDQSKARRAVTLSIEKYCSVIHSLAADIRITHEIELV